MMELLALLLVIWAVVSALFCITRSMNDETRGYPWHEPKKGRIKTNFNGVALVMNIYDYLISVDWQGKFTPKSPIQREIMQEEKEIKQLEKQKADMERLDQLRERKEKLWEEVNGESLEERILKIDGFETTEEALEYMHNTLKDL